MGIGGGLGTTLLGTVVHVSIRLDAAWVLGVLRSRSQWASCIKVSIRLDAAWVLGVLGVVEGIGLETGFNPLGRGVGIGGGVLRYQQMQIIVSIRLDAAWVLGVCN